MNRESRKANLRRLQLPDTSNRQLRRTHSNKTTATISNYFTTPQKSNSADQSETITNSSSSTSQPVPKGTVVAEIPARNDAAKSKLLKRTKLTAFLGRQTSTLSRNQGDGDVFVTPAKQIKKAPRIRKTLQGAAKPRSSRQPKIKSSFLRNEQMFAEITAQHCIADEIDPDEMQMALAISQSEAEANGELQSFPQDELVVELVPSATTAETNNHANDSIHRKLQKYGFRTAAREEYDNFATVFMPYAAQRRGKGKWANKFTALTLRNTETQTQRLQKKVAALLARQCTTKLDANEATSNSYSLLSPFLKRYQVLQEQAELVKYVTAKSAESTALPNLERFFVNELFDVVHLKAGHLLKDWSTIQGRDFSPSRRSQKIKAMEQRFQAHYKTLESFFDQINRCNGANITLNVDYNEKELDNIVEAIQTYVQHETISESLKVHATVPAVDPNSKVDTSNHHTNETHAESNSYDSIQSDTTNTPLDSNATEVQQQNSSNTLIPCSTENLRVLSTTLSSRALSPDIFGDSESDTDAEVLDSLQSNQPLSASAAISNKSTDHTNGIGPLSHEIDIVDLTAEGNDEEEKTSLTCFSTLEVSGTQQASSCERIRRNTNPSALKRKCSDLDFVNVERQIENTPLLNFSNTSADSYINSIDLVLSVDATANNTSERGANKVLNSTSNFSRTSYQVTETPLTLNHNETAGMDNLDFSFLELIGITSPSTSDMDLAQPVEPILSTPQKIASLSPKTAKHIGTHTSIDPAEFGILESHSEPISEMHTEQFTLSQFECASTSILSSLANNDANSLTPPSPESTAPMKCYSNGSSSQKFSVLLRSLEKDKSAAVHSLNDSFDELDKSRFASPKCKQDSLNQSGKPTGFEQLLTSRICFEPKTEELIKSTTPTTVGSVVHVEELEVNGNMYSVRPVTAPKPDFAKQNEVQLQRQLYMYGIKCLPRKQAVKLLEYVYNQTHPIILVDDNVGERAVKENDFELMLESHDVAPNGTSQSCHLGNRPNCLFSP